MKKIFKTIWENNRKLMFGILILVFIIVFFIILEESWTDKNNSSKQAAVTDIVSEEEQPEDDMLELLEEIEKSTQSPEDTEPLEFSDITEEELQSYYAVYEVPYVLHLRKALNGYLTGTNEGMDDPEFVINGIKETEKKYGIKDGLASFSKDYYKSKFVVMWIEDSITGGKNIDIVFQDKPDNIFRAWVYGNPEANYYDLRAFYESTKSSEEKLYFIKLYENFILDKEHAI